MGTAELLTGCEDPIGFAGGAPPLILDYWALGKVLIGIHFLLLPFDNSLLSSTRSRDSSPLFPFFTTLRLLARLTSLLTGDAGVHIGLVVMYGKGGWW